MSETPAASVGGDRAAPAPRLDALFLMNSLDIGGSERKIVRLANRLPARNLRPAVLSLNGPDTLANLLAPDIERECLERRGKFSLRAVQRLARFIARRRPRVLFCVNLYPTLYAVAAAAVLGKRAPPIVGLLNTTDFGPRERWRQRFYLHVLKRLDWLVFGCELQRSEWSGIDGWLRERAQVIYNGVDLEEFRREAVSPDAQELRRRAGYPPGAFVIGSVGRLIPAKNHQVLIDALATLRAQGIDARLIVAGDGPLRAALEASAKARALAGHVVFTGALTDVRPLLSMLDVFVLPSLYIETFSNAALEAMSMSLPVVLSRVGGASEMIRHGEEGFLVDPSALAERLPELLGRLAVDTEGRREMGRRARRRVEAGFAFENMVDEYASLIRSLGA